MSNKTLLQRITKSCPPYPVLYMNTHMQTQTHKCVCACTCKYRHTHTYTHNCMKHTNMCTCTLHPYTWTCAHKCIHTPPTHIKSKKHTNLYTFTYQSYTFKNHVKQRRCLHVWNTVTFCGVGVGKAPAVGFGLQSSPMCKVCSFLREQKNGNTPVLDQSPQSKTGSPYRL